MSTIEPQPKRYYEDSSKLTYDETEFLIELYFLQDMERSVTRVKHVLSEFQYPPTQHNQHRVLEALQKMCKQYRPGKSGPARFYIPERYQ